MRRLLVSEIVERVAERGIDTVVARTLGQPVGKMMSTSWAPVKGHDSCDEEDENCDTKKETHHPLR